MALYAHAIPQVEPPLVGNHLLWMGPHTWGYSLTGWDVQRLEWRPSEEITCDRLEASALADIKANYERELRFGVLRFRSGEWPAPIGSVLSSIQSPPVPCEVYTLEFDSPQSYAAVHATANKTFVVALFGGKAVAAQSAVGPASANLEFRAVAIDAVAVYVIAPQELSFCVVMPTDSEDERWQTSKVIVQGLQLPLRELMPGLGDADGEYAAASTRLLPGESLSREEFERIANILRVPVSHAAPPRLIDQVLLLREKVEDAFDELKALDPIYALMPHPKWRRVLGFGWFDDDPSLAVGETYQYRITGYFPNQDLSDAVYGFHTIPSGEWLPTSFYLGPVHFRLSRPVPIVLVPQKPKLGKVAIARRGVEIPPGEGLNAALVVTFPKPLKSVVLELEPGHQLVCFGAHGLQMIGPIAVSAGAQVRLQLPVAVTQLHLFGRGTLFAIRVPGSQSSQPLAVSIVLPPVKLENTPRPAPPIFAWIDNLQKMIPPPSTDAAPKEVAPRHALGFEIHWRPAVSGGSSEWPLDFAGRPPLDAAIFKIEHCQVAPPGQGPLRPKWNALLPPENWFMGGRDQVLPQGRLALNEDAMQRYPEGPERQQAQAQLDFAWKHAFHAYQEPHTQTPPKPVPQPGTYHQYRVRSVDVIGRPSDHWCETNVARLEKRIPPPVPVGPDDTALANRADPKVPEPAGVQVRILIREAPDLTHGDVRKLNTLNASSNVVLLRWGWHDEQRKQDPFAREFRVYLAKPPLDRMKGELLVVAPIAQLADAAGQSYQVVVKVERALRKDELVGCIMPAGYPFYIKSHTAAQAGQTIVAVVETLIPESGTKFKVPAIGTLQLPVPVGSRTTRPPAWSTREAAVPITAEQQYEYAFVDKLSLTPVNPEDCIWVGVSAADDQPYVDDQLAPAQTRPGNESAIVPAIASGRYHGRPKFDVPPPLADVPVFRTPEPANRPLTFSLDLTPYLEKAQLGSSDRFQPERASVEAVFSAYRVQNGKVLARVLEPSKSGDTEQEVTIGEAGKQENPADRAAVVAALSGSATTALENRFLLFLAGVHPYRDRLFQPAVEVPVAFGAFDETLAPKPGRWVYRVRKSDQAGHLSAGSAMAHVVVSIPSLAPGATPEKLAAEAGDSSGTLRMRVVDDPYLTHLLTFSQPATRVVGPPEETQILRIPNTETLYASGRGVLLRAPDGSILTPTSKALSDADVVTEVVGPLTFRRLKLEFNGIPGSRIRVWACTLTRDGVPSPSAGPWAVAMDAAPLPTPVLKALRSGALIHFSWIWQVSTPPACTLALEELEPDQSWKRISALLIESVSTFDYTAPAESQSYRLSGSSPDGREVHSNSVTL